MLDKAPFRQTERCNRRVDLEMMNILVIYAMVSVPRAHVNRLEKEIITDFG